MVELSCMVMRARPWSKKVMVVSFPPPFEKFQFAAKPTVDQY
jgi:hypothetical protein